MTAGKKRSIVLTALFVGCCMLMTVWAGHALADSSPPPSSEDKKDYKEDQLETTPAPKIGTLDNPIVKKEKDEITPSDYGDSFQIIGSQNADTCMKIVDKLVQVKNGTLDPAKFYKEVSALEMPYEELRSSEMPKRKQMRHLLMLIKRDIGNHLGRNGVESVFGKMNGESTLAESKILPERVTIAETFRDKAIQAYAKTNPAYSVFYSEVGSWSTEKPGEMKFAGDIDFSFMCGNMDEALKLKQIYDDLIYKTYGRTPEEMDIPCTAHGMATGEVYIGKSGQSQVEGSLKKSGAKVVPISFGENGKKIGLEKPMDFKEALDIMLLEAEIAKTAGGTPLPDLEELGWKEQPGVSYEMARHFEHDIMHPDVYTNLESFVKAAKYLDRSFTAMEQDKGKGAVKNKKLRALVEGLVKAKKSPKAQVQLLKDYYGNSLPYGAKLELNENGKGTAELIADQKLVKEFWETCNKALWDDANASFKEVSKNLKNKLRKVSSKDPENAKAVYDELNMYVEMMEIEDRILTDPESGVGKHLNEEYKANMSEFRNMVKEFKQRAAKSDLLKVIDPKKAEYYKFIDQQVKIDTPFSHKLAAVAMTMAKGPGKVNDILDFMDDGLLNEFRYGENKEFDVFLRKKQNLSWNEQADQFLKGTGLEGYHSKQLADMEAQGKALRKQASEWMGNKLNELCENRGIGAIKRAAGAAGSAAGYASNSIKKVNNTFSQSVEASRGGQAMMSGMMLYNLSQEIPQYVTLIANGDWEGFAVEFFRRRAIIGGAVENAVMGDYWGVLWEVTTTVVPPASLLSVAKSIGETIGHETFDFIWSSELEILIDNLYEKARFRPASVERTGTEKDTLSITQWELISVTYRGKTYDFKELIQSEKDGAREMAECLCLSKDVSSGEAVECMNNPIKAVKSGKEVSACFPWEKVNDGIFEWWKASTAFQEAFKKTDPWMQMIIEMSNAPHVGEKLKDHFQYKKEVRWEQLKVVFLTELKTRLEKQRATKVTLLNNSYAKLYDELLLIAGKLNIRPQVEKAFNDEFGGMATAAVDYIKDLINGKIREFAGEFDILDREEEMAAYVTSAVLTYKKIWEERKKLEALFSMKKEDKELIRLFTGPDFLTGNPEQDEDIPDKWTDIIKSAYQGTQEELKSIKGKYVQAPLALAPGNYDYDMLLAISSAQIVKRMYTWSFLHSKSDKKSFYKHHAKKLEMERKALLKQFENHYMALDTKALDKLEKDLAIAAGLSKEALEKCNASQKAAGELSKTLKEHEKKLSTLEQNLKKLTNQTKSLEEKSQAVKKEHAHMEKQAAAVMEKTQQLESLSLEVCKKTNSLNDPAIPDAQHRQNYAWVVKQKTAFKDRLAKVGQMVKKARQALESSRAFIQKNIALDDTVKAGMDDELTKQKTAADNSKKTLETANLDLLSGNKKGTGAKSLKASSKLALEKFEKQAANLLNTASGKELKTRIAGLKKMADAINIKDCPKQLTSALEKLSTSWEESQKRVKNISLLYAGAKKEFDENRKAIESIDQSLQNVEYLVDLSEAYIERAQKASVDGAFCTVLADGIMERSFVPDVQGKNLDDAIAILLKKGFAASAVSVGKAPSSWDAGVVTKQSHTSSKRVAKGTTITLSHYDKEEDQISQLASTDCSQWPGSQAVWDTNKNQPGCGCVGDMVWNASGTQCISQKDAMMAKANCSNYPNTRPVWNEAKKRPECACIPNTKWNSNRTACIGGRQLALENTDCSQFPGTFPVWDNQNNRPACGCPDGTRWVNQMKKCVNVREMALASADCSHKPGSKPEWDYAAQKVVCACQMPYTQDYLTGKCVDLVAEERKRQDELNRQHQQRMDQMANNMWNFWSQMAGAGNSSSNNNNRRNNTNSSSGSGQNSLCNMKGIEVLGIWNESGKWYSCLTGVHLTTGNKRVINGKRIDCLLSGRPPGRFKRVPCGTRTGRCTMKFIVPESKNYGQLGFLRKGEEVCMYIY